MSDSIMSTTLSIDTQLKFVQYGTSTELQYGTSSQVVALVSLGTGRLWQLTRRSLKLRVGVHCQTVTGSATGSANGNLNGTLACGGATLMLPLALAASSGSASDSGVRTPRNSRRNRVYMSRVPAQCDRRGRRLSRSSPHAGRHRTPGGGTARCGSR